VLLVDDEPTIRKMIRLMLQSHGFRVYEVSSGAEAIALTPEHPIDLLLTDVVMDDMDGFTLAQSLVGRHPNLPVLFMSGYPTGFEAERQRYGRCAFLRKPFQKRELMEAISDLSGTIT
jgi:CheY-like chemotaxis protein